MPPSSKRHRGNDDGPATMAAAGTTQAAEKEAASRDRQGMKADPEAGAYFAYYACLQHQQNMLEDSVRTGAYHRAITTNRAEFEDKVVLDVGTGSGILAFFAIQAGARHVYAVEASNMARRCRQLVRANGLQDRITVVQGKVEDVELPEKVDVIVSEPMGVMLVHEQMLQSYVRARERFLRPGGRMFPTTGTIFVSPFTDAELWRATQQKTAFWSRTDFCGVDVSSLRANAEVEAFEQPVVGYFAAEQLVCSPPHLHVIDFETVTVAELDTIRLGFRTACQETALVHGLAFWFDVDFVGAQERVRLSTAPDMSGTHWYQCRMLFHEPLAVNVGQTLAGALLMTANDTCSYDVHAGLRTLLSDDEGEGGDDDNISIDAADGATSRLLAALTEDSKARVAARSAIGNASSSSSSSSSGSSSRRSGGVSFTVSGLTDADDDAEDDDGAARLLVASMPSPTERRQYFALHNQNFAGGYPTVVPTPPPPPPSAQELQQQQQQQQHQAYFGYSGSVATSNLPSVPPGLAAAAAAAAAAPRGQ